jgi:hypothetical protein
MNKIYNTFKVRNQQSGLVSLLVAMILMIVLSLMVLGFSQNTRREQRQSLDRQLFSQANYAAETGINDVAAYIKARQAAGSPIEEFDLCGSTGPIARNFIQSQRPSGGNIVDGDTSYSCALLNPQPEELIWQNISLTESVAFPFNPSAGNTEINIAWQDASAVAGSYAGCSAGAGVPASGAFASQGSWACQAGALRIDITPINLVLPIDTVNRNGLINSTYNFVLYPVAGPASSTFDFTTLGHGGIVPTRCAPGDTPRHCKIKLTNATANRYYIRIRPIYRAANIFVTGSPGINLRDAQATVDVTGKANDILKRLQVRLSINALESDDNSTIDYALQSIDTMCKRAAIIPGGSPPVVNQGPPGEPSCP